VSYISNSMLKNVKTKRAEENNSPSNSINNTGTIIILVTC